MHVDIAVKHIVLWVLVRAVYAFLGKEHCDFRPGNAADIGVKIDGAANFVLDQVECFARSAYLFARNGNSADTFRCAFNEAIVMALSGGANDHNVVSPMPSGHTHATDVVFKTPGGNLGRNYAVGLRVNVPKVFGRRERDACG